MTPVVGRGMVMCCHSYGNGLIALRLPGTAVREPPHWFANRDDAPLKDGRVKNIKIALGRLFFYFC